MKVLARGGELLCESIPNRHCVQIFVDDQFVGSIGGLSQEVKDELVGRINVFEGVSSEAIPGFFQVSGFATKSHTDENGNLVIDDFELTGASVVFHHDRPKTEGIGSIIVKVEKNGNASG